MIFIESEVKPAGWSDQWYEGNPYIVWGSNGTRGETSDGFVWVAKDGNEVAIIGYNGNKTEVVFPETIEGYTVTEIADGAFLYECLYVIPKNVTVLEVRHVMRSTLVTENTVIPSGWNIVSEYAVVVENYSGEYGQENGLTWIGRKDGTACIVSNYFLGSSTQTITIPSEISGYSVTEMRGRVFENFNGIVVIPSSVKTIPLEAFYNSYNCIIYTDASENPGWGIGNIEYMSIVYNYGGENGIYNNFVWAMRKDGTACIVRYTGYETDIVIPSQIEGHAVREILRNAFATDDIYNRMESLTIPESVQKIGSLNLGTQVAIFAEASAQPQGCNISNDRVVWNYGGENGTYNNFVWASRKDGTACIAVYTGWETNIVIPSQIEGHAVQEILRGSFEVNNASNRIKSLTIPKSVQKIDYVYFNGQVVVFAEAPARPQGWNINCDKIVWNYGGEYGITDEGLLWTSLRDGSVAVYGISSGNAEAKIEIPAMIGDKAVTKIIGYAFQGNSSVVELIIPVSVVAIENNAFTGSQITKIYAYALSQPAGWGDGWNINNGIIEVVWGYTGE